MIKKKKYSETCNIIHDINDIKNLKENNGLDIMCKSIEYSFNNKTEISFATTTHYNFITPIIEGTCDTVLSPTNIKLYDKIPQKNIISFHTHPDVCSIHPSVTDLKGLFFQRSGDINISKDIIGTKCKLENDNEDSKLYNVLSILDVKKLKRNKKDYDFIKNKLKNIDDEEDLSDEDDDKIIELLEKKYLQYEILDCDYSDSII